MGERQDGYYIYACDEHTADEHRQGHRVILRDEAEAEGATCEDCGLELAEARAF